MLIATGRSPNTDRLHLERTGVKADENEGTYRLMINWKRGVPGIYALGDVKGGPAFTHISYNDYLVVYKNIIEQKDITINNRPVTYCIFHGSRSGTYRIERNRSTGTAIAL